MIQYGTPADIVPKMKDKIAKSEGFWLVVTGNSMSPTLKHLKDSVYISPFSGRVKKGDILLTEINKNHCLLHRVIKCDGDTIYYGGDALPYSEGPLPIKDVIGIVTKIKKNGRIFTVNNFIYIFYIFVWYRIIKLWRFILKGIRKLKRLFIPKLNNMRKFDV